MFKGPTVFLDAQIIVYIIAVDHNYTLKSYNQLFYKLIGDFYDELGNVLI